MKYKETGTNGETYIIHIDENGMGKEVFINLLYKIWGQELETTLSRFNTDEPSLNTIKTDVKVIVANIILINRE